MVRLITSVWNAVIFMEENDKLLWKFYCLTKEKIA